MDAFVEKDRCGDMKPLIIVLEDSNDRMDWLRNTIIGVDIIHHLSVLSFVQAVNEHKDSGRLRLVVFDHDLGHTPPHDMYSPMVSHTTDADGYTGHDAAKMLDSIPCAALVWSLNDSGRKRIGHELVSKCSGRVYAFPYGRDLRYLADVILREAFPK